MKKNSSKNRTVSQEVRRELSRLILDGVKDPRVAPLTTVTDVYVAPDLKTAKVYVSVYGDMRLTPQLFFTIDDSLEYGMKMDALISSLHKDETAEEESEDEEQ